MKGVIQEHRLGEGAIFLSCFFFAAGAVLIKIVSHDVPVLFISFCNFAIGGLIGAVFLRLSHQRAVIRESKYLLLRGAFGAVAMIGYFAAIHLTNSGRATLLNTTFPVFSALFGTLLFREKLTPHSLLGLMLCVAGACCVFFDPGGGGFWGNSIGLLSGASGGMAAHYVKKARKHNHSVIVYLSACVAGLPVTVWSVPQATHINIHAFLLLPLIAGLAFAAQVLMSYGFKHT